jgi:hypothetical protein
MKYFLLIPFLFNVIFSHAGENPGSKSKSQTPAVTSVGTCTPGTAYTDLYINNVRAGLLTGGDMWWNLSDAKYEVPAGSGKHSMFAGSLWIGGIDAGGQIMVAGQTYRQTGTDYWPGAMDTTIVDISDARCQYYDNFWKINRQDVLDFVNNGTTTPEIITWPGNGSATDNEGHFLAPFYDANGDGIYNHLDGDYPGYNLASTFPTLPGTSLQLCEDYLLGHQSVWWVINDVGNIKTETSSPAMGIEIRCQAFAYQSGFASLNQTTFYKYQVINRSSNTYNNTYFGQWVDPDLGNAVDDYVGCDVVRGLGYCYNGDADDNMAAGYGIDPPAIGVDFLKGPIADLQDGIDNDRDGCTDCTFVDSSGTTIVLSDAILPETISMAKFVYYNNANGTATGNPNGYFDFYNYLRGFWLNNQPITYGGDGTNPGNPVCNYMFPGTTDPAFPTNWTETTAGNLPEDRRFIQSAGPFTLEPGEVNNVTTAVIWARATGGGPQGSVNLLQAYDTDIQSFFTHCFDTTYIVSVETAENNRFIIYPNPANEFVCFDMNLQPDDKPVIDLFNTHGELVMSVQPENSGNYRMDTRNLSSGNYFCRITIDGKRKHYSKIVVVKP